MPRAAAGPARVARSSREPVGGEAPIRSESVFQCGARDHDVVDRGHVAPAWRPSSAVPSWWGPGCSIPRHFPSVVSASWPTSERRRLCRRLGRENPIRISDGPRGNDKRLICGAFEGPLWSPDGRHLAYRSEWTTPAAARSSSAIRRRWRHRFRAPAGVSRGHRTPPALRRGSTSSRRLASTAPTACARCSWGCRTGPLVGDHEPYWSHDGTSLLLRLRQVYPKASNRSRGSGSSPSTGGRLDSCRTTTFGSTKSRIRRTDPATQPRMTPPRHRS